MDRITHGAAAPSPPVTDKAGAGTTSDMRTTPPAHRASRWLGCAQVVWVISAVLALGVLFASVPGYLEEAHYGDFVGQEVEAPFGLVRALDVTGVLASFMSALICLALAGLLFWRKRGEGMALFVSFYLLAYGVVLAGPLEQLDLLVPGASLLATNVLQPVLFVAPSVALLAVFPNGRFVPRWTRWLVMLTAALSLLWLPFTRDVLSLWWADPTSLLMQTYAAFMVLALGAALYAQIYRYRRMSSPTERQQAKWVASGVVGFILLASASYVAYIGWSSPTDAASLWISPPPGGKVPWWTLVSQSLWWLSLDIIPLALTIAVLRLHLFDIDLLIRRTLVYGTLSAILGAVYLAGVLGAQSVVRAVTGQTEQEAVFIVVSTLLVIALFTPLRRRVQATIDRRFYRRKYNAEQTLAAFGRTLRDEVDLERLGERLLAVVEETMQPEHVSLWLRVPPTDRAALSLDH